MKSQLVLKGGAKGECVFLFLSHIILYDAFAGKSF